MSQNRSIPSAARVMICLDAPSACVDGEMVPVRGATSFLGASHWSALMCVCVCVCMYVCRNVNMPSLMCVCVCMYVNMPVRGATSFLGASHWSALVYVFVCMYVCASHRSALICVCMYVHIHA